MVFNSSGSSCVRVQAPADDSFTLRRFALLYPPSLILPLSWSLGVFCLLHFFLGGAGVSFLANSSVQNRWFRKFLSHALPSACMVEP
jgi:hypothetical protein